MATMSPRLQILLPEYRAEPGYRLTPWVLLSALLIGSGLVLLLWHRPSLKLITKTGYPTQHTFQILPEPLQGGRAVPTARPHSTPAIRPTRPTRTFSHPGGYPSVRPQVVVPTTPMVPGSTRKATSSLSDFHFA
ncbi:hypothetical protein [Acidithiobacillus sp. HP-11]|uniref:hypothetical protein n=1 Tax=Acidithiobacillus sp. HP-11 TaxID=2697656 RepID=UPI00187A6E6A|nr:hypothetical protein [Acidithiobacillus sp. HP-11]MBE7566243.1 hypothetical protein [Acidithiobacillus sp. HP-11]